MKSNVDRALLDAFLISLGNHQATPARLTLLGGCALILLGRERTTLDIDYVGDDLVFSDFQRTIAEVAAEMNVDVDAVPINRFVPIPSDSGGRDRRAGQFGLVDVFVLDPYVIALSKVDRGLHEDLDDVTFMIKGGLVDLERLAVLVTDALERAAEFDIDPAAIQHNLRAVRGRMAPK